MIRETAVFIGGRGPSWGRTSTVFLAYVDGSAGEESPYWYVSSSLFYWALNLYSTLAYSSLRTNAGPHIDTVGLWRHLVALVSVKPNISSMTPKFHRVEKPLQINNDRFPPTICVKVGRLRFKDHSISSVFVSSSAVQREKVMHGVERDQARPGLPLPARVPVFPFLPPDSLTSTAPYTYHEPCCCR